MPVPGNRKSFESCTLALDCVLILAPVLVLDSTKTRMKIKRNAKKECASMECRIQGVVRSWVFLSDIPAKQHCCDIFELHGPIRHNGTV